MDKKKKSTAKKSSAPKIKDLDSQQRKLALIKQKRCDAIALYIVNKLIDCPVEEDVFLQSLKYMNQCHYQDIVEERAISKMCGYPICGKTIPDMPKKQFHISTKSNKIFDITDRKNYCSNYCYKAGTYIKEQMLTSPLWFRDKEEIPNFHLLPKTAIGTPGIEIDQGIAKLDVNDDETFTSISEFTKDAINEVSDAISDKLNLINENEIEKNKVVEENLSKTSQATACQPDTTKTPAEKELHNYCSLYMPNLIDILKENANYFDNESKEKFEWVREDNTNFEEYSNKEAEVDASRKKDKLVQNITEEEKELSNKDAIKRSKSFDRTIINTKTKDISNKTSVKIKGILSKSSKISNKNETKKQVSFSTDNSERHISSTNSDKRDSDQQFKRAVIKKAERNSNTIKNVNLIGSVREKSDVYKYELSCINVTQKEYNANLKHESNFCNKGIKEIMEMSNDAEEIDNNQKDINSSHLNLIRKEMATDTVNKLSKPEMKHDNIINDNNTYAADDKLKEKRISRLKNSATYRKNKLSKNRNESESSSFGNLRSRLKKYIREWITCDTILFLHGNDIKRKISADTLKQYMEKKASLQLDIDKQKQYDAICKRLNLMELADRKFDESVTGKKLRPLPRYEELKKQAETVDFRVKAFYSGCYEVYEDDTESETDSVKEDDVEVDKGFPAVLPLVESKDIIPLRRKIFLTSLSRIIPNICEVFKQCPNYLLSDMKKLIDTFNLSANNIVFKTNEWHLVGIILVKMLSIRDNILSNAMEDEEVYTYINSILKQFAMNMENFKEFMLNEDEVEYYLKNLMSKEVCCE